MLRQMMVGSSFGMTRAGPNTSAARGSSIGSPATDCIRFVTIARSTSVEILFAQRLGEKQQAVKAEIADQLELVLRRVSPSPTTDARLFVATIRARRGP